MGGGRLRQLSKFDDLEKRNPNAHGKSVHRASHHSNTRKHMASWALILLASSEGDRQGEAKATL